MCALAQECAAKGKLATAQNRAAQSTEDYVAAIDWYHKAFRMKPGNDSTWYLLHNNLGYCLNRCAHHPEAAEYAGRDRHRPSRHNAHNLGMALKGQGCFVAGARVQAYLEAATLCPDDNRRSSGFSATPDRSPPGD